MATPFAALEARVNTAAMAKLANATALIGGVPVDGVFDELPDSAFGGLVQDTSPVFTCSLSTVVAVDAVVVIGGKNYSVVAVDPDGRGFLSVRLK